MITEDEMVRANWEHTHGHPHMGRRAQVVSRGEPTPPERTAPRGESTLLETTRRRLRMMRVSSVQEEIPSSSNQKEIPSSSNQEEIPSSSNQEESFAFSDQGTSQPGSFMFEEIGGEVLLRMAQVEIAHD